MSICRCVGESPVEEPEDHQNKFKLPLVTEKSDDTYGQSFGKVVLKRCEPLLLAKIIGAVCPWHLDLKAGAWVVQKIIQGK